MQRVPHIEAVVSKLVECLSELDAADAPIAAAYLDSSIEALCRQFSLSRNSSKLDVVR